MYEGGLLLKKKTLFAGEQIHSQGEQIHSQGSILLSLKVDPNSD